MIKSKKEKLLEIASAEVGVVEDPPGSNAVKYNTWYYGYKASGSDKPWCMAFVQWVYTKANVSLPAMTASCGQLMRAAKAAGLWVTEGYQEGDVVILDLSGNKKTSQHCGIVIEAGQQVLLTIEGNTSDKHSDVNGGAVCRKTRVLRCVMGAVRPAEFFSQKGGAKKMYHTLAEVPEYYRGSVERAINAGVLKGESPEHLGLNEDLCKVLTWMDRAGVIK